MGVPARKMDVESPRGTRPRVSVVKTRPASRRRPCDPTVVARRNFVTFATLTVVICVFGLGRVWLSVQAAEASLESGRLRDQIKTERYRGDMLEVQQSALSSPSRIRALAGATMDMEPIGKVTYVDLPAESARTKSATPTGATAFERAVGDVLALAAGEAHVLLIGDVGLASAR